MLYKIVAQASGRADQTLEGWTTHQLARLWGVLPEEVETAARDLLRMSDERAEQKVIEWFGRDKRAVGFINEFRSKRRKLQKKAPSDLRPESQMGMEGMKVYKKEKDEDEFVSVARKRKEEEAKQAQLQREKQEREQREKQKRQQKKKNQKAQKQSLNQQGELYLPGRNLCDCQARRHPLLGNCLWCGKIICKQEGEGPCLFCSHEVDIRYKRVTEFEDEDEELLSNPDLMQAIQHKDKLLEYDRNAAKRTAVYDDQSDFYTANFNQWLTPEEREKAKKRQEALIKAREENKRKMKITFDIAGRRVIVDNSNQMPTEAELEAMSSSSSASTGSGVFANPFVDRLPIFIPPKTSPPDSMAAIVASAHNNQPGKTADAKKDPKEAKKKASKDKENTKPKAPTKTATKPTVHRIQHEYFADEGED